MTERPVEELRPALDDRTADRLLAGRIDPDDAPPGYSAVAATVQRATAPAESAEQADPLSVIPLAATIAGMWADERASRPAPLGLDGGGWSGDGRAERAAWAARSVRSPGPVRDGRSARRAIRRSTPGRPARRSALARTVMAKTAVVAVVVVGGGTAAALTGGLPLYPTSHAGPAAIANAARHRAASPTDSSVTRAGSADAANRSLLYGLCSAYLVVPTGGTGSAGAQLAGRISAAGGTPTTGFCQAVVAANPGGRLSAASPTSTVPTTNRHDPASGAPGQSGAGSQGSGQPSGGPPTTVPAQTGSGPPAAKGPGGPPSGPPVTTHRPTDPPGPPTTVHASGVGPVTTLPSTAQSGAR